jgi:hypothetical protein
MTFIAKSSSWTDPDPSTSQAASKANTTTNITYQQLLTPLNPDISRFLADHGLICLVIFYTIDAQDCLIVPIIFFDNCLTHRVALDLGGVGRSAEKKGLEYINHASTTRTKYRNRLVVIRVHIKFSATCCRISRNDCHLAVVALQFVLTSIEPADQENDTMTRVALTILLLLVVMIGVVSTTWALNADREALMDLHHSTNSPG